jgi:hypothetical protein
MKISIFTSHKAYFCYTSTSSVNGNLINSLLLVTFISSIQNISLWEIFHHSYECDVSALQVFDDVAVELTMALLQYFNSNPPEERLFRCMKALNRFCQISQQDVPQLIQMIGPEPAKFRGTSARVDDLITQITKRLR